MRAALREPVPGPGGVLHPAGEQVTMVESEIFCDVDVAGRRETLPLSDLYLRCEVPGCGRRAEYVSPGDWCATHWSAWWNADQEEPWMRAERRRPESVWTMASDVTLEDGTVLRAGTALDVRARHLMVMVRVQGEGIPFQLHREQLSITCEVPACAREAARWTPRYLCAPHWDDWAEETLDIDALPPEDTP